MTSFSKKLITNNSQPLVSEVIKLLTVNDIFVWGSIFVATPLVAVYLTGKFGNETASIVGLGSAIYYLVRGLTQLAVGTFTDRIKSDNDEIALLIISCALLGLPYLFIPSITEVWHFLVLQAVCGLGASFNLNSWRKLFARNLDKNHTGYTYGVYETSMSLATAGLGFLGSYLTSSSLHIFSEIIMSVGIVIASGGLVAAAIFTISKRNSAN